MDPNLEDLEKRSISIIREAKAQFKNLAVLWSTGKDSTLTLWLCRKAFYGKIPFPVIHIDTGYKFPQIYEFRNKITKEWNLNLIIAKNEKALEHGMSPKQGRLECCTQLKTEPLKNLIEKEEFDALLVSRRTWHKSQRENLLSQRRRLQMGLQEPASRDVGPIRKTR
jgi:sulfate adenylyltransferase subunit 2